MSSKQLTLWTFPTIGSLLLLSHLFVGCSFRPDDPHYLGLEYKSEPPRLCPTLWYDSVLYGMIKTNPICLSV